MTQDTREINITARLPRKLWYQLVAHARAHRIPTYKALEQAIRESLQQAGVEVDDPEQVVRG